MAVEERIRDYKKIHHRINKLLGKLYKCEHCDSISAKVYDWANISGEYKEIPSDWKRLCRSCHQRFDAESFIGKRNTGKKATAATRQKMSESHKRRWATDRQRLMTYRKNKTPRTHCLRGHEFTLENTILFPSRAGTRLCKICYNKGRLRRINGQQ